MFNISCPLLSKFCLRSEFKKGRFWTHSQAWLAQGIAPVGEIKAVNGSSSQNIVIMTADKKRSGQIQFLSAQEVLARTKGKDDLKTFIHEVICPSAFGFTCPLRGLPLKAPCTHCHSTHPRWTEKECKHPDL